MPATGFDLNSISVSTARNYNSSWKSSSSAQTQNTKYVWLKQEGWQNTLRKTRSIPWLELLLPSQLHSQWPAAWPRGSQYKSVPSCEIQHFALYHGFISNMSCIPYWPGGKCDPAIGQPRQCGVKPLLNQRIPSIFLFHSLLNSSSIEPWQKSIPLSGAAAFCTTKIDNFWSRFKDAIATLELN